MKATSRQPSAIAGTICKLVGTIMIFSSLIDYGVLLIPPTPPATANPEQAQLAFLQWQQNATAQLIDRGIIPLVGLVFIFLGFWLDSLGGTSDRKSPANLLKPMVLALSALLGLAFLLPIPLLNFNSARLVNQRAAQQINQQAEQAESVLKERAQQATALSQDEQRLSQLNQAISSGSVQGVQLNPQQVEQLKQLKTQLEQFKQDPKALEQQINQAKTQILSARQQAVTQNQRQFGISAVRSGVSSVLLGIGYLGTAAMGALGLMGAGGASRR
jgi:hypothetical protein